MKSSIDSRRFLHRIRASLLDDVEAHFSAGLFVAKFLRINNLNEAEEEPLVIAHAIDVSRFAKLALKDNVGTGFATLVEQGPVEFDREGFLFHQFGDFHFESKLGRQ